MVYAWWFKQISFLAKQLVLMHRLQKCLTTRLDRKCGAIFMLSGAQKDHFMNSWDNPSRKRCFFHSADRASVPCGFRGSILVIMIRIATCVCSFGVVIHFFCPLLFHILSGVKSKLRFLHGHSCRIPIASLCEVQNLVIFQVLWCQ